MRLQLQQRTVVQGERWTDAGRLIEGVREPTRHRLACLSPHHRGMSQMRIERMGQAHLTIRKLGKVAVRKHGGAEIGDEPVIDIRPHRFDRVERER